jgi:hypothetical protein
VHTKFKILPQDKIATAGSCFAQHISQRLAAIGSNFWVAESPHPLVPISVAKHFNYGVFSCRYGNIYTARQLLQLLRRALGIWETNEEFWPTGQASRCVDALRPGVEPGGFLNPDEAAFDRQRHLLKVRRMFEACDVFVFTLGLTESWCSRSDNTVFPVCPGVVAGQFCEKRYFFANFSYEDVASDLIEFLRLFRGINPSGRVLLTVSPVPLTATAQCAHVLVANTASKSILRAAASAVCDKDPLVEYFPSYEIITGAFSRGAYYEANLREVTGEGVDHVMSCFLKHYCPTTRKINRAGACMQTGEIVAQAYQTAELVCDEELLEAGLDILPNSSA